MSKTDRDLYQELRAIGLTHDQVHQVLDWVDTIPIHLSADNTKVQVEGGVVKVTDNRK
jgi:hypothetical protein